MTSTRIVTLFALLATAACAGDEPEVDTTARGVCTYQDAATDSSGEARAPASPAPQPMQLEIEVEGTGAFDGLEPDCQLDGLTGSFAGLFAGEASIGEDGAYAAGMASAVASFATPGGCEIPQLDIEAVTRVTVRATITATEVNCQGYCAARARSQAEAECGADASAAACRAAVEGEYQLSCSAACTSGDDHVLVAEAELSAAAIAALGASDLSGGALGEIEIDLTFDRIADAEGRIILEQ